MKKITLLLILLSQILFGQIKTIPLTGTNQLSGVITSTTNLHSQYKKYSLVDSLWVATHSTDSTKFIPRAGTYTAYPITGSIQSKLKDGQGAIYSKDTSLIMGWFSDPSNAYNSSHPYSVIQLDTFNFYTQFWKPQTQLSEEFYFHNGYFAQKINNYANGKLSWYEHDTTAWQFTNTFNNNHGIVVSGVSHGDYYTNSNVDKAYVDSLGSNYVPIKRSGVTIFNWNSGVINDNSGNPTIRYFDKKLVDASSVTSIDWLNRKLYKSGAVVQLDWSGSTISQVATNFSGNINVTGTASVTTSVTTPTVSITSGSSSNLLSGSGTPITVGSGLTLSSGTLTSSGGGSGTVNTSTIGQVAVYSGTNTVSGNPKFVFNSNSSKLQVGTQSTFTSLPVIMSVKKDTAAREMFIIENSNIHGSAVMGLYPYQDGLNVAQGNYYLIEAISDSNTTFAPQYRNSLRFASGSNTNGMYFYNDKVGSNFHFSCADTYSAPYNYFPDAMTISSGSVAINLGTSTLTAQNNLDVIGGIRTTGAIVSGVSNVPYVDANGNLNGNTHVLANIADGGITAQLKVTTTSGLGVFQVYTSDATSGSSIYTGNYNASLYGNMRTNNASFSSAYPFMASATTFWNRGGELDLGSYDAYKVTFFTSATGRGNIASGGNWYIGDNTTSANSTLQIGGSISSPYVAKTANYTVTATDNLIDCTANTFSVTLPTAASITGREYIITNSGAGTITVATTSSQTINGSTTMTLSVQYGGVRVRSNGSNWVVTSKW